MTTQTTRLSRFDPLTSLPPKLNYHLPTNNGDETVDLLKATQLGHHTSKRMEHYRHPGLEFAPQKHRCSACRWFEVYLFRTEKDYVLWSCGHTIVPQEKNRITVERTHNPYLIVELMTVRKGEIAFLPAPSAHVLADAANIDEGILEAYVNRATP